MVLQEAGGPVDLLVALLRSYDKDGCFASSDHAAWALLGNCNPIPLLGLKGAGAGNTVAALGEAVHDWKWQWMCCSVETHSIPVLQLLASAGTHCERIHASLAVSTYSTATGRLAQEAA